MPDPAGLSFTSWRRSALYGLAQAAPVDGRLTGRLDLSMTDPAEPGVTTPGSVPFHFIAPRDIDGIDPRTVLRTAPAAGVVDAETTKMVHIDFADPALPWQYSPTRAAGTTLRPWIVLLVGDTADMQIDRAAGRIRVQPGVIADLDLTRSHLWAHVQREDGRGEVARLVCPHRVPGAEDGELLIAHRDYTAAVVIAFDDAAGPAWTGPLGSPIDLTLLYSWSFRTGDSGDFESLATAIDPDSAAGLGTAPLRYARGAVRADVHVRGAISTLADDTPTEITEVDRLRADVAALVVDAEALPDPLGRSVIGPPRYGRSWVIDPRTTTWGTTLNDDPRLRGTAALGVRMGQDAQDDLVAAIVAELGATTLAAHLVAHLAFGVEISGSLWRRKLPDDATEQVALLAPLLRRLRATSGGSAMEAITGAESPLVPEVFSTAARRMLRPRTARTRHTTAPITHTSAIGYVNTCRLDPVPVGDGFPGIDSVAEALGAPPAEDLLRDPRRHRGVEFPVDIVVSLLPQPPRPRCDPTHLGGVAGMITPGLDPRGPNSPGRRRVQSRIHGLDIGDLRPPEYPAGVDYPTWILLRDRAKEWLLPGVGTLDPDSVVAMQTNPTFIDAFLVGINEQILGELRWRNIPIDRSSTPLLSFWRHIDYRTGARVADIRGVGDWTDTSDLGDAEIQVPTGVDHGATGDLVLVFRTDLFRRYPKTLVYLIRKPVPDNPATVDQLLRQTPGFLDPTGSGNHIGPNFQGTISRDVVFFSFDIDPDTLEKFWVVLDEPPTELRFRRFSGDADDAPAAPLGESATTSASFANATLDHPSRVAFDGADLKARGLAIGEL
jgi:hypothetical protein